MIELNCFLMSQGWIGHFNVKILVGTGLRAK